MYAGRHYKLNNIVNWTRLFAFVVATGIHMTVCAQQFVGESSVSKIDQDGFYNISISPGMSPYLNATYTNVRIFNKENKEVPYLIRSDEPVYHTQQFHEYKIIGNTREKDCCSHIVFENPQHTPINNVTLFIRNAEVSKQASLLGSDDQITWYAIKDRFGISSISNAQKTSELRILNFPLSNYNFYRIDISDSASAPLNIISAGYFGVNTQEGRYTLVDAKITTIDSTDRRKTYLKIVFNSVRTVDRIRLEMKGSPYFLRQSRLFRKYIRADRKGRPVTGHELLSSFVISSKQPSVIDIDPEMTDMLIIEIDNQDNPALTLASANVYQLNRYITAYLNKGQQYKIKFGEKSLGAATYDIGFFQDAIPGEIEMLSSSSVRSARMAEKSSPTFFTSRLFVWVAIGAVIVLLGFMSIRMVREVGKGTDPSK